ncbi:MAG TPA: polysaccharide biosynthesis/export family protein [Roseiarcus sp.]|nr:polysaccharide biosynthesis/export family protein [Roseiarcus sp.]
MCACSTLPDSGPSAQEIAIQANAADYPRYEVVDIDPLVVASLRHKGWDSFSARFGDRRISSEPVIGIGDSVTVTIWEASSGGLFSAPVVTDRISVGSNSAMIPEQVVGRDGGVTVPYAGRIHVAGKTTRAVQTAIEHALEGKAIQPQVLVNVTRPISNSVSVGGEVANGARIPLSVKGDRLLDVVAAAGGVRAPVNETFVELSRGSKTTRMPLVTIINKPAENIYLHPNDVLTLVRDPQTFLAYGATGRNAEIPFDADGISLAQALVKAGGLLDNRSDPRGVFVFRYEKPSVLRSIRPESLLAVGNQPVPVVYRLNLMDANSLFLEQSFPVANRDLMYVSNSPSTDVQKVFAIIGGGIGTIGAAGGVVSAAATIH